MAEALRLIVRQRRRESEEGKRKEDMLGALLAGDNVNAFSDEEIVDFLLALLVAGYETTSTIMTLAVKFLTETPLAQAQLKVLYSLPCFFLVALAGLATTIIRSCGYFSLIFVIVTLGH